MVLFSGVQLSWALWMNLQLAKNTGEAAPKEEVVAGVPLAHHLEYHALVWLPFQVSPLCIGS